MLQTAARHRQARSAARDSEEIDYDLWCGPAAKVDLYRPQSSHYDWHWDYNTGNGDMGNQGIHQMDIARWFLGVNELSPRIVSFGGRLGYDDAGNTANTQVVLHDYPGAPLIFETRGLPKSKAAQADKSSWERSMDNFRGSQVGVVVQCENGSVVSTSNYDKTQAFGPDGEEIETWRGDGDHFGNFLDAVRSRKRSDLHADVLDGHLSSALCHTGRSRTSWASRGRRTRFCNRSPKTSGCRIRWSGCSRICERTMSISTSRS